MRNNRFVRTAQWPRRMNRNKRTAYESNIPPRDWKYWLVVALFMGLLGVLVFVLLKAS